MERPLTAAIRQYNLMRDKGIVKVVTLNYDIISHTTLHVDEEERRVTLVYHLPFENERAIVHLLRDSQLTLQKEMMPSAFIGGLLRSFLDAIYHHVAEHHEWHSTWLRTSVKASSRAHRGIPQDKKITASAHPMSEKEIKEHIYQSIRDRIIDVWMHEHSPGRIDEGEAVDKLSSKFEKRRDHFTELFIERLKKYGVIGEALELLVTEGQFRKHVNIIATHYEDEHEPRTKRCEREGCNNVFLIKSGHGQKFCSKACKQAVWRSKKKGGSP